MLGRSLLCGLLATLSLTSMAQQAKRPVLCMKASVVRESLQEYKMEHIITFKSEYGVMSVFSNSVESVVLEALEDGTVCVIDSGNIVSKEQNGNSIRKGSGKRDSL